MQIEVTWLPNIMKNAHSGSLCHMEITSAEMLWNKSPLRGGWIGQKWTADMQETKFVLMYLVFRLPGPPGEILLWGEDGCWHQAGAAGCLWAS